MKSSIKIRWQKNILFVLVAILLVFSFAVLYSVYYRYFSSTEDTIRARINQSVDTFFAPYTIGDDELFAIGAGEFVETFLYKDIMEVWVLDKNGNVIVSSSGFSPETTSAFPDFESALYSDNNIGVKRTHMDSGEPVTAMTYILRNNSSEVEGAVRYLISMEDMYQQLFILTVIVLIILALIIMLITMSGMYFVSSIVNPLQKISATTTEIAKGNFSVRIENSSDDEIGELCTSINNMAKQLSEIDKMKNEFISTVSHEIRTPLTAIKGWGETLQNVDCNSEINKKGLEVIIDETTRLSAMVEELLDFSRMQNGNINLINEKVSLKKALEQACEIYVPKATAEKIELKFDTGEYNNLFLIGDYDKIRQVFVNILDNAIKYTPPKGLIEISLTTTDNTAKISFKDNGCGISEYDLIHVKEKFYKANNTIRGTGIGLAVADEIIRMHGGELNIVSTLGIGTTVDVVLPISCKEDANE